MSTIRLFSMLNPHSTVTECKPEVSTPLGTVLFHACIGEFQTNAIKPTTVVQLQNNASIFSWQTRPFDLELLLRNPGTSLARTDADDCWAGIWRLEAKEDTAPVLLACSWTADARWTEGGANSGQYLMAWTWDKEEMSVSIGTEDDDWLLKRVRNGGLPQRWTEFFELPFWEQRYGYDYDRQGICVQLPAILKGECCEIKLIVAWTSEAARKDLGDVLEIPAVALLDSCRCR